MTYSGVPLGHEFESFVISLIQAGGRPPKISDEAKKRIESIEEKLDFTTFVSLSCVNCPETVSNLNLMAVLNENISSTIIEGSFNRKMAEENNILSVPKVFLNKEDFLSGRKSLDEILDKLTSLNKLESTPALEKNSSDELYDLLVIGQGPSGVSASIYAARKSLKTIMVGEVFGGQVLDTGSIENIIGNKIIEGPSYISGLKKHVEDYPIELASNVRAEKIEKVNEIFVTSLSNKRLIKSKTVIVATGASYRNLNIPGEKEFKGKGVSYCTHCDGPFFSGMDVAVIGGGNSGVEAAIDLSSNCRKVYLIQRSDKLSADEVLQERLKSKENVQILLNAVSEEIVGEKKVEKLIYKDKNTGEKKEINLSGIFVQIGLDPNTEFLNGLVEKNKLGEILVDESQMTSQKGLFAAGDCTNSKYKQIVISLGSGASAGLAAYDYIVRNGL
ncbi:alkyl hydroperoxide reductase subunit F [Citroniella saccharovorans]|uniref:Alkyl hydroperoxide reductase subunit F n=1 Tax=Citroniella saccharovorans TaxID=2053367 RepID=A0AAW9MND6_9FIRM|nr:alkyl hydroperoxide reductase subunit F [Citroniella saccharovorans]MEB3428524.1 alkyl hydroperoxide reductase subunit F [Citroniella saccharovorans]